LGRLRGGLTAAEDKRRGKYESAPKSNKRGEYSGSEDSGDERPAKQQLGEGLKRG
jgi:hypothetical protein